MHTENREETIIFKIPPYPTYRTSSFREFTDNEWHITRNNLEYILIVMFEGTLCFTENGKETELNAGDWYIQRPHRFQSANRPSLLPKYYYIHFALNTAENDSSYFPAVNFTIPLYGKCNPHLYRDNFNRLSSIHPDTANGILALQSAFLEFLIFFFENETNHSYHKTAIFLSGYMREHYHENITAQTLSKLVNYSDDYIRIIFKERFGQSPMQFLKKIRMEEAKRLLSATDYSVELIADMIGYSDSSVFYRNFCKVYGMNPSKWRNLSRNLN